jgi:signal transduction histidine kinase
MEIPVDRNYPKVITLLTSTGFQLMFTLLTFSITVFYNVAYYIYVPLTGVWLDYADHAQNSAIIYSLDPGGPGESAGLMVGDYIISIDGRAITDLNIPVHQPKKPGELEIYQVKRGEEILTIPVQVGSYLDHLDSLIEILPVQLLSLLVCLFGLALLFFSPPSDVHARLVALAWVLVSMALAATGPGYTSCVWLAPQVAILTFAVSIFILISAHLYFPMTSFSTNRRNVIIWGLFGLSLVLSMGYVVEQVIFTIQHQNPPTSIFSHVIKTSFYVAVLLSIGLLFKNRFLVKDREVKRQTGIIFLGTLTGFLPFMLFNGLPDLLFGHGSPYILLPSSLSILTLIFLPISYGYVIYQRRLLKIDFMINRALVLFLLVVLSLFASFIILSVISIFFNLPARMAVAGSLVCILFALPSAKLQQKIQVQVDRFLYGSYYDYKTVTSDLSSRMVQTIDRLSFVDLLINKLPKEMKISKSNLLLLSDNGQSLQEVDGNNSSIPLRDRICESLAGVQHPIRAQNIWPTADQEALEDWKSFFWAQLFVPITHHGTLYGVLLLGDRITGDIYSNQDLQILTTVSQQAALSIANIFLVERLRGLAQQLVRSDEEQRKKVARDLHDSVLQNLFFVKQRLARSDPEAADFVDHSIGMIRQTIKAQRSSLLDRGLMLAVQDLISHMQRLAGEDIIILWHNHLNEEIVLPDEKATNLYRIIQEALINVLKHSSAEKAVVSARKENGFLEIRIKDDGIGMAGESDVILGHHYGILGMQERASMIGAEMNINSHQGSGTTVLVKVKL